MLRTSVIRRVMRQRAALGLNPLGGDSEEDRERRLDAARDRAFAAVTGTASPISTAALGGAKRGTHAPKRTRRSEFPEAGAIDELFREARKIR
jgi:hypothetical protein